MANKAASLPSNFTILDGGDGGQTIDELALAANVSFEASFYLAQRKEDISRDRDVIAMSNTEFHRGEAARNFLGLPTKRKTSFKPASIAAGVSVYLKTPNHKRKVPKGSSVLLEIGSTAASSPTKRKAEEKDEAEENDETPKKSAKTTEAKTEAEEEKDDEKKPATSATTAAAKIITELDVVVSFDTTASMTPVLFQVRRELEKLVTLLFTSLSAKGVNVRFGAIAHGDYDSASQYIVQHLDLTDDVDKITKFITTVQPVSNFWNEGEAYEQALRVAKSSMSWRGTAKHVLVLTGDDKPHPANFPGNTDKVDWKTEASELAAMDVPIYSVQCPSLAIPRSLDFYQGLADAHTRGAYILLSQFALVNPLIEALLYHATGDIAALQAHESKLETAGTYNRHMELAFNTLLGRDDANKTGGSTHVAGADVTASSAGAGARVPVAPGRFQSFVIEEDQPIKEFVMESVGEDAFKAGGGFYELIKEENVSDKKEVVMEHKRSGDMFSGADARALISLPSKGAKKVSPSDVPNGYRAYIQSTSWNRSLKKGQYFMYQVGQC